MKVILRSDLDGLGKRGDIVDVADGHARNFLLPKGHAIAASDGAVTDGIPAEDREALALRIKDAAEMGDMTELQAIAEDLEKEFGVHYAMGGVQAIADAWAGVTPSATHLVVMALYTLVAGAPDEDELDTSAGAVYVFQRNLGGANNWGEAVKLLPDELRAGLAYDFGTAVAISGDTIAVGAIGDDDAEVNAGAVYVFSRNEGGTDAWGRTGLVDAGGLAQNGLTMGNAVALEGEPEATGRRLHLDRPASACH